VKRKFIVNLIFLLFLNLLIKPFWIFGVERGVQNAVGTENFGLYFSLFNFSYILNIILDLGITNFNNKNIAQNPNILSKYVSNIVTLRILLGIIYTIIALSIGLILGYDSQQMLILGILAFNQFLISFTLYLRSNISGLQMFKTDSVLSILDRFLMIVFCGILLWGNVTEEKFKIEWFVLCQTIAYLLTFITALTIVLRQTTFFKFNFNYKFFLVFLRQSYPYALLTLLMVFYNKIDSVMLERLLENGKEQAGIYAQAFRITDVTTMFSCLFAVLLLPMFAKMIKDKENVEGLTKLSFVILIIPAIVIVNICLFFNLDIMTLMYKEHFNDSAPILGILMIGFLGISTSYIFGTLLTANGNLKYLNIMAACGMVLNITLNFILIPKFHVKGAAIASMTTQILTSIAQVIIAKFVFNFKINYKLLFQLGIFILIITVLSYFLHFYGITWYYSALIIIVVGILLSFALRLLKLKEIFGLLLNGERDEFRIEN
jgi:O-antigen/teichoic acid export membrane protein